MDDSREAARSARLRYLSDDEPGIRRKRAGRGFTYLDAEGQRVTDEETLARVRALAIPPAWTDVWIAPIAHGHVQATGRDAKSRKQYRYHARWHEVRDRAKYGRLAVFGRHLPAIRERVGHDMRKHGLPREKVLATVVSLLEATLIRVGNAEYARDNDSYGLTTLRNRHVDIEASNVRFHFRGKSGKQHEVGVSDRRLARVLRQMSELPGHELFQYVDEDGERHRVDSADVNEYLREITGEDFTAKDFRTWWGTVLAILALAEEPEAESKAETQRRVNWAVDAVAKRLGNTRAICRRCYIHPAVIEAYEEGDLVRTLERHLARNGDDEQGSAEAAVIAVIERSAREQRKAS